MSRIERSDLEAKLSEIKGAVDETAEAAKNVAVAMAIGVVVVVVLAFLVGRRKGKKSGSALVEVYRL
jgi:hypothetical protein